MTQNNEIWRDIKGYEGLYQVSNFGRVKHKKKGNIRVLTKDRRGYMYVRLSNKGIVETTLVHRLVAKSFLKYEDANLQVNHIDECKSNNHISNLEWVTAVENCNYGNRNKNIGVSNKVSLLNNPNISKRISQYDMDNNLIKIWDSMREVGRSGFTHVCLHRCCNGTQKSHKGYKWRYTDA